MPLWVVLNFGDFQIFFDIFLESGIVMILMTDIIVHLKSQVNDSMCIIYYINNYFVVFTFYVAMAIEDTGLMHAS